MARKKSNGKPKSAPIVLEDGSLAFTLRWGDGSTEDINLNALFVRIVIDEVGARHAN